MVTEFQWLFKTNHFVSHHEKINMAIDMLVLQKDTNSKFSAYDQHALCEIAIAEGSKSLSVKRSGYA